MKKTILFDVDNTLVCREKNVICDYTIKGINMCKNNFEEKMMLFFEKTREMFQALNSTNETLSKNVEANRVNIEKLKKDVERLSNRISNLENQLPLLYIPTEEDWDRGFVVGEVEADKEM